MGFRGSNPLLGYWHRMLEHPTVAEASLEPHIAALGLRYRCQQPFLPLKHFADFALLDEKILIEVDGDSHDTPAQKEKDLLHMLATLKLGWVTVRAKNLDALEIPAKTAEWALRKGRQGHILGKDHLETVYLDQLHQLHQDYPHLLALAANAAKSRRQSALVGAQKRREAKEKKVQAKPGRSPKAAARA